MMRSSNEVHCDDRIIEAITVVILELGVNIKLIFTLQKVEYCKGQIFLFCGLIVGYFYGLNILFSQCRTRFVCSSILLDNPRELNEMTRYLNLDLHLV